MERNGASMKKYTKSFLIVSGKTVNFVVVSVTRNESWSTSYVEQVYDVWKLLIGVVYAVNFVSKSCRNDEWKGSSIFLISKIVLNVALISNSIFVFILTERERQKIGNSVYCWKCEEKILITRGRMRMYPKVVKK